MGFQSSWDHHFYHPELFQMAYKMMRMIWNGYYSWKESSSTDYSSHYSIEDKFIISTDQLAIKELPFSIIYQSFPWVLPCHIQSCQQPCVRTQTMCCQHTICFSPKSSAIFKTQQCLPKAKNQSPMRFFRKCWYRLIYLVLLSTSPWVYELHRDATQSNT